MINRLLPLPVLTRVICVICDRIMLEIGRVEAIFRYPVKSMGGEPLEAARLGWHGLDGDRRLAFRQLMTAAVSWLTRASFPTCSFDAASL